MKKYIMLSVVFTMLFSAAFSQAFKAGDKAEALVNNAWKEVTVLKLVSGKKDLYEVQAITATGKSSKHINQLLCFYARHPRNQRCTGS